MARALVDSARGALGARTNALERRALVNVGGDDLERLGAHALVLVGVGHGGLQDLLDVHGDGALAELKQLEGTGDGLVADLIDDKASLARSDADILGGRGDPVRVGVLSH